MANIRNKNFERLAEHFLKLHARQVVGLPEYTLVEDAILTSETPPEKVFLARMYYAIKDLLTPSEHFISSVKIVNARKRMVAFTETTIILATGQRKVRESIEAVDEERFSQLFTAHQPSSDLPLIKLSTYEKEVSHDTIMFSIMRDEYWRKWVTVLEDQISINTVAPHNFEFFVGWLKENADTNNTVPLIGTTSITVQEKIQQPAEHPIFNFLKLQDYSKPFLAFLMSKDIIDGSFKFIKRSSSPHARDQKKLNCIIFALINSKIVEADMTPKRISEELNKKIGSTVVNPRNDYKKDVQMFNQDKTEFITIFNNFAQGFIKSH